MIDDDIRAYAERYRPYKGGRWCYEDGCLFKGLADLHEVTGAAWQRARLIELVNHHVGPDGAINGYDPAEFSLDNVCAGKVLFPLRDWTGDPRYEIALRAQRDQLRDHPRTREGGFWHKKTYPWQVWLDGVYMALPLLARFGLEYGEPEAVADVRRQVETVRRRLRDPASGLYHHGYDESRSLAWADPDSGLSKSFWSRAIGWYAMALADLAEILPDGHPDRAFYAETLREMATAVLPWQRPDGLWMQVMDQPRRAGNYAESSASAMFAYTFLKGGRLGILDHRFEAAGQVAFDGLSTHALRGGSLEGICLMAGLGPLDGKGHRDGSFDYYVGEPVVRDDPKGFGPLMMARAEILRSRTTRAVAGAAG